MISAAHAGSEGQTARQPYDQKMGTVYEEHREGNFDAMIIKGQNSWDWERKIGGNSSGDDMDYTIQGIVGWDKIVDNVGNPYYRLAKQGIVSGRDWGEIVCATTETCEHNAQYRSVIAETGLESGDSGGPLFETQGSDAYIVGNNVFGNIDNDGDGYTEGEATYVREIENQFGIIV